MNLYEILARLAPLILDGSVTIKADGISVIVDVVQDNIILPYHDRYYAPGDVKTYLID